MVLMRVVVVVVDVMIVDTKKDLNIYKEGIINAAGAGEKKKGSCCKPAPKACCGAAPEVAPKAAGIADYDLNEFAGISIGE